MNGQQARAVAMENGNLPLGIGAGLIAALLGAALWMAVTIITHLHIGYVALAIGAMVGYAIRVVGKGSTIPFGVAGAVLTLLGCLLGQAGAEIQLAASQAGVGFFQALTGLEPGALMTAIFEGSSPITYFIYAIGIYEGYKLSINR
jgi:hypothetical protein